MMDKRVIGRERRRQLLELNDEDLMLRLQQGEVQALNVLQDRHTERLYYFLLKFTREPQLAEDLSQETFLRVYRSRHTYRKIARFTTWLFTIAGNVARSEYRKRQRVTFHSIHSSSKGEWDLPANDLPPDERIARRLESERVLRAIDRLPERFREVVMLRGLHGMSYDEIHRLIGVPIGTIKSRIHRGRRMLGKALGR